jgi:hypothetical protein
VTTWRVAPYSFDKVRAIGAANRDLWLPSNGSTTFLIVLGFGAVDCRLPCHSDLVAVTSTSFPGYRLLTNDAPRLPAISLRALRYAFTTGFHKDSWPDGELQV